MTSSAEIIPHRTRINGLTGIIPHGLSIHWITVLTS